MSGPGTSCGDCTSASANALRGGLIEGSGSGDDGGIGLTTGNSGVSTPWVDTSPRATGSFSTAPGSGASGTTSPGSGMRRRCPGRIV